MPVDKAISWPLSQEKSKTLRVEALRAVLRARLCIDPALLKGGTIEQALFLTWFGWSKNEQRIASHAGYGAATGMNGLSTGCSTVFVRKLPRRA
jgi:hypothetical protein